MVAVAGIHFGNTNSVITVSNETKLDTVSNETGDRVTPSIVAYTGDEKVIGKPAKQFLIRNPLSCIANIKAAVGSTFTDAEIQEMKNRFSCEILNKNNKLVFRVKVENDTINVRCGDAASYIFTKLLEIAENVGGADLEDVVLTVPVKFSAQQRISLSAAAEHVGCNILRLISEPAAALLAYGIGQEDASAECTALVFRLGGTSMDATLMSVNSGMYRCIGQESREDFGAKNFDNAIVKHLIQEFKRKTKEDITDNKRAIGKLKAAIEECKHGLTNMTSNHFNVDSLHDGMDFNTKIVRATFESLCNNLFQQCIQLVDQLLQAHSLTEQNIHKVVFVGGGTRMPKLVEMFKSKFTNSEILNSISPEEVLSVGAAIQASLLQGREDIKLNTPLCPLECLPKNMGVKTIGEDGSEHLEVLLPKHTPVPSRRTRTFPGTGTQTSVGLSVYESEDLSLSSEGSRCLGTIVMRDIPVSEEGKEFALTFEANRSGNVVVMLTEKLSGKTEQMTIHTETS